MMGLAESSFHGSKNDKRVKGRATVNCGLPASSQALSPALGCGPGVLLRKQGPSSSSPSCHWAGLPHAHVLHSERIEVWELLSL